MHSLIHEHLAHASARHDSAGARRGRPPSGRLRLQAARLLANLAGRLDSEQARRSLA
jgi:hypothetical protein